MGLITLHMGNRGVTSQSLILEIKCGEIVPSNGHKKIITGNLIQRLFLLRLIQIVHLVLWCLCLHFFEEKKQQQALSN